LSLAFQEGAVGSNESQKSPIVSIKARSLVIATGCFTALAGSLALGVMFSLFPGVMVVGALLQPRFRNLGRGLMLAGALLLSAWVLPYGVLILFQGIGRTDVMIFTAGSVLLVAVCDVALVVEEVIIRCRATPRPSD
jgi:hypothetical protein